MYTTYSAANCRCDAFFLKYTCQTPIETTSAESVKYVIKAERHATKKYRFLDMTPAAAATCASDMSAKYMRTKAMYTYSVDAASGAITVTPTTATVRTATVENTLSTANIGTRDVSVTVAETDVKYVAHTSSTLTDAELAALFATEDARDYNDAMTPSTTEGVSTGYAVSLTNDLDVSYAVIDKGTFTQFERYATKSYVYFGMTQAAAESRAASVVSQYLRYYYDIDSSTTPPTQHSEIKLGAAVSPSYNGHTWSVTVSVDETDVRVASASSDPATVFALENARDYTHTW